MDCIDLLYSSYQYGFIFSNHVEYDEYKQYLKEINDIIYGHIEKNMIDILAIHRHVFNHESIFNKDILNVLIDKTSLNSKDKERLSYLFKKINISTKESISIKDRENTFRNIIIEFKNKHSLNNKIETHSTDFTNKKIQKNILSKTTDLPYDRSIEEEEDSEGFTVKNIFINKPVSEVVSKTKAEEKPYFINKMKKYFY